jgi:multiple sugar transport system permease protein
MSTEASSLEQTKRARVGTPWGIPHWVGRFGRYVGLAVVGLILFLPFILAFLGSFKSDTEITAWPPTFLPSAWHLENWGTLWNTDFGGVPRPEGTSSLGLVTGLCAFLLILLLGGLSGEAEKRRLPDRAGLGLSFALAALVGLGASFFLQLKFGADPVLRISVGVAIAIFIMMGLGLLALSRPDWGRVLVTMLVAAAAAAVLTLGVDQLAVLAGGGRFFRWFFNTALLSVLRAVFMTLFCSMAAFAFARLRFPGRNAIFNFMLFTMMIPGAVTLIPNYVIVSKLGWVNAAYSVIFPVMVNAFGIFMLTQFLRPIPRELEEAALMDGASFFQIYRDVVLPLARPALLTVFILQFQGMWNDFLTPLLYFNTPDMWVMNVALSVFQQQYKTQWNLTLVGAMINAFVPLTLFFFFSRYYIEGVAYSGLKG